MNSSLLLEKLLQKYRFSKVKNYLKGSILDFGGNRGELKDYIFNNNIVSVKNYKCVNDIKEVDKKYDTIVCLAVIEHIEVKEVFTIIRKLLEHLNDNGTLILTTPSIKLKWILEFLAFLGILDKENIKEHKHYWSKTELEFLAADFSSFQYNTFQLTLNQIIILNK